MLHELKLHAEKQLRKNSCGKTLIHDPTSWVDFFRWARAVRTFFRQTSNILTTENALYQSS
jgi:hypothetical protein